MKARKVTLCNTPITFFDNYDPKAIADEIKKHEEDAVKKQEQDSIKALKQRRDILINRFSEFGIDYLDGFSLHRLRNIPEMDFTQHPKILDYNFDILEAKFKKLEIEYGKPDSKHQPTKKAAEKTDDVKIVLSVEDKIKILKNRRDDLLARFSEFGLDYLEGYTPRYLREIPETDFTEIPNILKYNFDNLEALFKKAEIAYGKPDSEHKEEFKIMPKAGR